MMLLLERIWPYGVAAILTALALRIAEPQLLGIVDKLIEPVINISAVSIGFMAAMLGILFTASSNRIIESLKTSRKYSGLFFGYIRQAIELSFLLLVVSGTILLLQATGQGHTMRLVALIWLFFLVSSFCAAYRIIRLLWKIIRAEFMPQSR